MGKLPHRATSQAKVKKKALWYYQCSSCHYYINILLYTNWVGAAVPAPTDADAQKPEAEKKNWPQYQETGTTTFPNVLQRLCSPERPKILHSFTQLNTGSPLAHGWHHQSIWKFIEVLAQVWLGPKVWSTHLPCTLSWLRMEGTSFYMRFVRKRS